VKLEEKRIIRKQLEIFSKLYPELVEKNSIRYPIEDNLIKKLPELHGATQNLIKPSMYKVIIPSEEFDELLYIWEFCNNFSDYLETPFFKIEDLRVALTHQASDQKSLLEEEDLEWNEQMGLQQVREKGLNLVNAIHVALADCYLKELEQIETKVESPSPTLLML